MAFAIPHIESFLNTRPFHTARFNNKGVDYILLSHVLTSPCKTYTSFEEVCLFIHSSVCLSVNECVAGVSEINELCNG